MPKKTTNHSFHAGKQGKKVVYTDADYYWLYLERNFTAINIMNFLSSIASLSIQRRFYQDPLNCQQNYMKQKGYRGYTHDPKAYLREMQECCLLSKSSYILTIRMIFKSSNHKSPILKKVDN